MALGTKAQTGRREQDDKGTYIYVKNDTGGDLSAGYIGRLDGGTTDGFEVVALLTSTTNRQKVLVLKDDIADGDFGRAYVSGDGITATVASGNYTAGNALRVDDSSNAVVDGGAAFSLDNTTDFAEVNVGGTSVTSITINMVEREVISQA